MNERVKLLADQCWEEDSIGPDYFNPEKFSELIIKDCVSQIAMIAISNFDNEDVVWTVNKSIENIEARFGINTKS